MPTARACSVGEVTIDRRHSEHRQAQIQARKTFILLLTDRDVLAIAQTHDDEFHRLLAEAERCGYIHYTRLAAAMELKDTSSVSRWFTGKTAPDRFRRAYALKTLERVISHDIERMEQDDSATPIGHLSMKAHPELGIDLPGLVA